MDPFPTKNDNVTSAVNKTKGSQDQSQQEQSCSRQSRFERKSERGILTLAEKRNMDKREKEAVKQKERDEALKSMIQADYKTRGLDFCYFCGSQFNVGEKIPRILVHCGHTFCTECLTELHHNFKVRCPICRKLVKQVETVDKLPLNFNVLYEIVERDPILRDINFEDEECIDCLICDKHDQRVQHFYCSNHLTVFCRECIKEDHTDERCFVVDLYEIEKMRKMHKQNYFMNKKQLDIRKDKADMSCATLDIPIDQVDGDSKWFLQRKTRLAEQRMRHQQLQAELQMQQAMQPPQQMPMHPLPGGQIPQMPGQPQGAGGLMVHDNYIISANNPALNMHPSMLSSLPQDLQNDILQQTYSQNYQHLQQLLMTQQAQTMQHSTAQKMELAAALQNNLLLKEEQKQVLRDGRDIDRDAEDDCEGDDDEDDEDEDEEEEEEDEDEEDGEECHRADCVGEDDSEDDDDQVEAEEEWKPPQQVASSNTKASNQPPRFLNQPSSSSKDSPAKEIDQEDLLNELVLGEEVPGASKISDKLKSEEVDILRKPENVEGS